MPNLVCFLQIKDSMSVPSVVMIGYSLDELLLLVWKEATPIAINWHVVAILFLNFNILIIIEVQTPEIISSLIWWKYGKQTQTSSQK